jgi:hypothetical protein
VTVLDSEEFWAVVWALTHVIGVIAMLKLRSRSVRQVHVAERWATRKEFDDPQDAEDLVRLTRDRHRRNNALVVVVCSDLALGLLVLSMTFFDWLDPITYRAVSRLILTGGEATLIVSAWMSVIVGDQLSERKPKPKPLQQVDHIEEVVVETHQIIKEVLGKSADKNEQL